MNGRLVAAAVVALAGPALAGVAPAHAPLPRIVATVDELSPAASVASPPVTTEVRVETSGPRGLALGIELGEPVSATVAWYAGPIAVAGAVGSGTLSGPGLSLHLDAQVAIAHLSAATPVRLGIGLRHYHHGYKPASFDEVPDTHDGVRASLALAWQRHDLELYVEAAPGVDFRRTPSCTLASGANSICPHSMESPFFLQLVIGARWFISH
jgi:hypothetical protein